MLSPTDVVTLVLAHYEPLAVALDPVRFACQQCSSLVTRDHINVWQWVAHDHIRSKNTRSAQLCDKCCGAKVA